MIYARIEADGRITLHDLAPELIAKWVAENNPKVLVHRPLVIDAQPVPTAAQSVVDVGYVIEPTQVRQTWALVDKSADQLEADAIRVERGDIAIYLQDLNAQLDITNAQRALLTNLQRINELEKDTRVLMRAVRLMLRAERRRPD